MDDAKIGKCVLCGTESMLDELFYQDKEGNRITILVCMDCMNDNLMNSLING